MEYRPAANSYFVDRGSGMALDVSGGLVPNTNAGAGATSGKSSPCGRRGEASHPGRRPFVRLGDRVTG